MRNECKTSVHRAKKTRGVRLNWVMALTSGTIITVFVGIYRSVHYKCAIQSSVALPRSVRAEMNGRKRGPIAG